MRFLTTSFLFACLLIQVLSAAVPDLCGKDGQAQPDLCSHNEPAKPDLCGKEEQAKHIITPELSNTYQKTVDIIISKANPEPNAAVVVELDTSRQFDLQLVKAKMYPAFPTSGSRVELFIFIRVNKDIENCEAITFTNTVKTSLGQKINDLPTHMRTISLCAFRPSHVFPQDAMETPLTCSNAIAARKKPYAFRFIVDLPKYIPADTYKLDTVARSSASKEALFHITADFGVRRTEL